MSERSSAQASAEQPAALVGDTGPGVDQPEGDLPRGAGQPARRALAAAGYTRLDQLAAVSEAELLALHGVGPKAIAQLRQALAGKGLCFAAPKKSG